MNKWAAIVLLVVVLLLPALPVAAGTPVPDHYFVEVGGACWLPDGSAAPTRINGASTAFRLEKPNFLVITCIGKLPPGAAVPKEITKVDYATAGLACFGKVKDMTRVTTGYGATVYPSGWSEMSCRFDLNAQDP